MPNHCYNRLSLEGPSDLIEAFHNTVTVVKDGVESWSLMDTLLPMPEVFQNSFSGSTRLGDGTVIHTGKYVEKDAQYPNGVRPFTPAERAEIRAATDLIEEITGCPTPVSSWYDWACTVYGTKWGDYETTYYDGPISMQEYEYVIDREDFDDEEEYQDYLESLKENPNYIPDVTGPCYVFQSAWGPISEKTWAYISKRYPGVEFWVGYWEAGGAFQGQFRVKDGAILMSEGGKYSGSIGG